MQSIKSTISRVTQPVRNTVLKLQNHLINAIPRGLTEGLPKTSTRPNRILPRALLHWLHVIWEDLFWLLLILGIIVALNSTKVFRPHDRVFPMWFNTHTRLWEGPIELSYPHIPMVLSTIWCAVALMIVPAVVFFITQLFVRSFWDCNAANLGLFKAMTLMTFFQCSLKQYIGEFRPYFLTACNPDIAALDLLARQSVTNPVNGIFPYHRVFATSKICNPSDPRLLRVAMQSFPSGHTGSAFACGVFLALYLNAKLKAFSDYNTSFWKMVAVAAPIIGAIIVAGGLTIDHNHHTHDILLSIPLGIFCAMLAYRASYLSLFSYQTNHIPLLHARIGQSVLPPALGAAQPVGQDLAVKWPKTPSGATPPSNTWNPPANQTSLADRPDLPVGSPNVPAGAPNMPAGAPNLPPGTTSPLPKSKRFGGDEPTEKAQMTAAGVDGTTDDNAPLNRDLNGHADFSERHMTNETVMPSISERRRWPSAEDLALNVRLNDLLQRGEQMV